MTDTFITRLKRRLREPLPGKEAQRRFEPALGFGRHFHQPPPDARPSAVVALLYPRDGIWHIPFVVRPVTMAFHAGQIGLPGGGIQPGESSGEAALRELEEELGVPRSQVELLGALTPIYLYVTNFAITPWLAATPHEPAWQPSPDEVAQVLHVPIAELLSPACVGTFSHSRYGIEVTSPCLRWQGHVIWGATALLLGELLEILGDASPK
ncbi:MAG: CoA pyrophosphatase [Planctomycetia bacterium]|nr:CoA pyrophosphatase [Planctomycetia bacterium]